MENKMNIADRLMGCPRGMELDCTLFDDVVFEEVDFHLPMYPIVIRKLKTDTIIYLTKYGQYANEEDCKCIIFPKGKTTWEGFVSPHKYKNGDVVITTLGSTAIIKEPISGIGYSTHCVWVCGKLITDDAVGAIRFARESEKAELFKAIKENGFKWDERTKTLVKSVEPKFKIGDRITNGKVTGKIRSRDVDSYQLDNDDFVFYSELENWELDTSKFDINTLVPFESKVLVRDVNDDEWAGEIFTRYAHKSFNNCNFVTLGGRRWKQCIPYEGNEHLLGTKDNCNEFYKIWK